MASPTPLLVSPRARARRVLDRLAFGPRPGEVEAVAARGPETWVRAQLAAPTPHEGIPAWAAETDFAWPARDRDRDRDRSERRRMRRQLRDLGIQLVTSRVEHTVVGENPLFESLVELWSNHFAVDARKGPMAALLPSYEYEVLRPHALGRFEDLLLATARHPAMLLYLDNWRSAWPGDGQRRPLRRRRARGLNENYARELLELHTLGDPGAFTQRDVEEVARAFTGWSLTRRGGRPRYQFRAGWHDPGVKRVLGESLPARGGERDGERVIALLARHPVTARAVARKLAVRFLADAPPPAAVARGAAAFRASQGDLRATLEALLLGGSELFRSDTLKLKTPFELVVSSLRSTGARLHDARGVVRTLKQLGQLPFLPPSPAGHPDVASAWMDPGGALERTRFAFALGAGHVPGTRIPDPSALDPLAIPAEPLGTATRRALATPGLTRRERLALALASPEFQHR